MLSASGKKVLLAVHIMLVATWIGCLIAMLLLQVSRKSLFLPEQLHIVDKAIFILFDSVVMNISITVALTGLLFSMLTSWGFFRFHWITTKWLTILALASIIMFLASPSINGMAALSDVFNSDVQNKSEYLKYERQSLVYTVIQLFLLIFIVFISVLKPWGKRKQKKVWNRKFVLSLGIVIGIALTISIVMQYIQLVHYRNLAIGDIRLERIEDGYYTGSVDFGFEYEVGVQIDNHLIRNIDILKNRDTFYAKLAEGITHKIIGEQKVDLDAVTGATTTSKILMKAIETALVAQEK